MEISVKTEGFTHDASYRQAIYSCSKEYESKFPQVEECIINCKERTYFELNNRHPTLFAFSNDGKKLEINIPQGKYYDNPRNGNVPKAYDQPSVESVWRELAFAFDKIIESQAK